MTDLRKQAIGRECQVRLAGICCHDPETVVLAHARIIGISGMGRKVPDFLGAWCCHKCHTAADTDDKHELDFLRGVLRTQAVLIREHQVKW